MANTPCSFCRKNIHHKATICPYCKKSVEPVSFWKTRSGVLSVILLTILGFGVLGMFADTTDEKDLQSPNASIPLAPFTVGQNVFVSGIDEDGQLVVPAPNLWKEAGGLSHAGQKVLWTVKSGTLVEIKEAKYINPRWFYLVETGNYGNAGTKKGWISETLLSLDN